jgi:hypothetical protein
MKFNNVSAGVFVDTFDFEMASLCMKDGLNRKYWDKCGNITGLWPSGAGALIFYQVYV